MVIIYMRKYYVGTFAFSPDIDIYHHGIKGQKWGVRRFVNPDGTLTPEGRRRYGTAENFYTSRQGQKLAQQNSQQDNASRKSSKVKTGVKIGLAIAGAGLAAYGAYKLNSLVEDRYRQAVTKNGQSAMRRLEVMREEALKSEKRRDRKSINSDFDSRREQVLDYITNQKSTENVRKNLKKAAKTAVRSLIKR